MNFTDYGDSFLVLQFREFYSEVIRMKERIYEPVPADVADVTTSGGALANELWQQLVMLLEKQQHTAVQIGGEYWPAYEEAKYVMVALADEIFLHSDWSGRYSWNFNLLESRIFQSHVAGEVFFQRLELHLSEKPTPIRTELAKIYLMALSLGFQGKYRGYDPNHLIATFRTRLYAYMYRRGDAVPSESRTLFPQAVEYTASIGEDVRKLPPARKWVFALAIVIFVMLGISHLLWKIATSDLQHVLNNIQ